MKGVCKTCLGCELLDVDNFKGYTDCINYIPLSENQIESWLHIVDLEEGENDD